MPDLISHKRLPFARQDEPVLNWCKTYKRTACRSLKFMGNDIDSIFTSVITCCVTWLNNAEENI